MKKILHISFITKLALILAIILVSHGNLFSQNTKAKIVKCYPNPATSVINFEFQAGTERNSTVQIYSFSGKKITDVPVSAGKVTVTLDNGYYRGIYVFQLRDKNGRIIETGKFQVVR